MSQRRRGSAVRERGDGPLYAVRTRKSGLARDGGAALDASLADVLAAAQAATEQTRRLRAETASLAQTQHAIQEANLRFADLYDFVPIPYLIVSNLGVIQHVNEAAIQMLGGEREWVVGRPLISYIDTPDMRKVLDSVLASSRNASRAIEVRCRAREGVRVVQMLTRRRHAEEGRPATFHIALVDLTELRRLEDERGRAEQDRERSQQAERVARAASDAKDAFLAMLSHELRTPLTPILAAADALVSHETLSPPLRAKMEIIRRNVKAEARLIDDLLDVARITRKKLDVHRAPTDVHHVLGDVLDGWVAPLSQRDIHLDFRLDAREHWSNADPGRLAQVFRNVVNNAAKFTEAGDTITVRSENDDGRIRVTIADSGMGMTEVQLQALFKPFVQNQAPSPRRGLGLGLVISQAIVEAHQGAMSLSSNGPGTGTTVQIELPTVPAPSHEFRAQASADREPRRAAKVLLVEDDRDTADMLSMLLALEGFQVEIASSLHAARQLAGCCEVVVSDIALPDGSGLELMRELRKRERPMRGIALSGYGSSQDVDRSLRAGFEEHLTKPVDLERLVAAVRRLTEDKA